MKPGPFFTLLYVLAVSSARADDIVVCAAATTRGEEVRTIKVSERLDILLDDGRTLYFPTLAPPRATPSAPDRPQEIAAELASLLDGKPLVLFRLGEADRWSRIPARLLVAGEGEPVDELLAAAGLAMAALDAGACGAGVRAAEAAARADALGLWADPDFAVLSADEPQDWARRAGALTLVEGRVGGIGRTPARLYLNLGARRGGLALTIARRNLPLFESAGLNETTLLNRNLRARGVLELGAGPQIELLRPDQIEILDGTR